MKPLVILEIANNHMGDLQHFKKIINTYHNLTKQFKDKIEFAIKFQYRNLDTFINSKYKKSSHKGVQRFETTILSENEWRHVIKHCRSKFKLICTPFDEPSIDKVLRDKFDILKIASCSANDWPLLEYLGEKIKKKKIICSLGGLTEKEISDTISFFKNRKLNVKFLYCVGKYPSSEYDLNLIYFSKLREIYGEYIQGFSTHENPNELLSGIIALSSGARIFEKHVGLQTKKYKLNKYSTNPNQLKSWLENLYASLIRLGSEKERIKEVKNEKINLLNFKRGIFAKKNLKKGQILSIKDVNFQFPSLKNQILSNDFSKFNQFILKRDINQNEPILKKFKKTLNKKNTLRIIRDKVRNLSNNAKITIPQGARIEISHHYGIENFNRFGLSMITVYNSKYCKKLLFQFPNQVHPDQFHKVKDETFFILYGKVKLNVRKGKKSKK